MKTQSPATHIDKSNLELKKIFSKTVLKPFTEKWIVEVKKYHVAHEIDIADLKDEEKKEDNAIYEKQIETLLQKGKLVLDGIENIENSIINAKEIDKLSEKENEFKIVGAMTRSFANFYLKYLEAFINLRFRTIEKAGIYIFAATNGFQNVSERRKDAKLKMEVLENTTIRLLFLKKSKTFTLLLFGIFEEGEQHSSLQRIKLQRLFFCCSRKNNLDCLAILFFFMR